MTAFTIHSTTSAPPGSRAALDGVQKTNGFVPNLIGALAGSPAALGAYLDLSAQFERSSFSTLERQVLALTISRSNLCDYCVAAHSTIAEMQQVPQAVIEAIRNDEPIDDPRLEALREFAAAVVEKRGWVSAIDVDSFGAAGFSQASILEVVLAVSLKTLTNYTNHIVQTPVDDAFSSQNWQQPTERQAS